MVAAILSQSSSFEVCSAGSVDIGVGIGVHVSIFTLMGMRIRRVAPAKIIAPLIKAEKAGLNMQISKMEAHYLAGGNLTA